MSEPKALTNIEALEMFKEHHPDINSIEQILEFTEDRFLNTFTSQPPFNGDIRKARKTYRSAQRIQEQITLLWANIKDTIGSPSIKNALFNNIPDSFFEHQNLIPAYNKIFGNLDYTETDHARSVLGPAAYFVDLMRFIEKHITPSLKKAIDETKDEQEKENLRQHLLENRQPRLFQIPLDSDSTYNLVPYIDIVNETLEDVIREKDKSPYEILAEAKFPMNLPFHLPLEEIRLYLKQLKTSLQEIYRLFSRVGPLAFEGLDGTDLDDDDSQTIFKALQDDHIIDIWGGLTPKFQPDNQTFQLNFQNPNFIQYSPQIIAKLKEYQAIEPEIAREILALSPQERRIIEHPLINNGSLGAYYGTNQKLFSIENQPEINVIITALDKGRIAPIFQEHLDNNKVIFSNRVKLSVIEKERLWQFRDTQEIEYLSFTENGILLEQREIQITEKNYIIRANESQTRLEFYFDIEVQGINSLENVDLFLEKTGLSHKELDDLLFHDLSPEEISAGLSGLLFINNTNEDNRHLEIEPEVERYRFDTPNSKVDINGKFLGKLNAEDFTPELKDDFKKQGFVLSTGTWEIKVLSHGLQWIIFKDDDEENFYRILLESNTTSLTIFENREDSEEEKEVVQIYSSFIDGLNGHYFSPQLRQTLEENEAFSIDNISLSNDIKVLVESENKWKVWDRGNDQSFMIRANKKKDKLTISDQPYDRLNNLTVNRLDRIYRFLKLSRKLKWSFSDLDWAIRTLQGSNVGETVLRFDGTNDYIDITLPTDKISNENAFTSKGDAFTLEAWVNPACEGINPIFAKGFPDNSSPGLSILQYLFWITPNGKLAFSTGIADGSNIDWNKSLEQDAALERDRQRYIDNPLWQSPSFKPLWYNQRKKELKNAAGETTETIFLGDGELAAIELEKIPAHNDFIKNGRTFISDKSIPHGVFTHVAISVNEEVDAGTTKNYRLKFYINGVLDCIWTLDKKVPVESVPISVESVTVNIGKDLHNEFFSGDITDIRLWGGILQGQEIAEYRFQRPHAREIRDKDSAGIPLISYWPLTESTDLIIRDYADFDFWTKDQQDEKAIKYDGIMGGSNHHSIPQWVHGDIALSTFPGPISHYAYHFNGVDEFVGGFVKPLALKTLTVEAWVNPKTQSNHPIISYALDGQLQYQLWLTKNDDGTTEKTCQLNFWHSSFLNSQPNKSFGIKSLRLKESSHVAAVMADSKVTFYLNGNKVEDQIEQDFDEAITTPSTFNSLLYLGRNFNQPPNYLQGSLQEVRIWSTNRTEDEIKSSYLHQLSGSEPGLAGYWRLDEPTPNQSGIKARDRSFSQNHLLPGGLPSLSQPTPVNYDEVILPDLVQQHSAVLSFDADQYPAIIQNQKNYGFGHTEQFTLEFWFKAEEPESDRYQILLSQGDEKSGLNIYLRNNAIHAYTWLSNLDKTKTQEIDLNHTLFDTQWHHITFTYNETTEEEFKVLQAVSDDVFTSLNEKDISEISSKIPELDSKAEKSAVFVDRPNQEWRIRNYLTNEVFLLIREEQNIHIYRKTPTDEIAYKLYLDGSLIDLAGNRVERFDGFRLDQVGKIYLGNRLPNQYTRFLNQVPEDKKSEDKVPEDKKSVHFKGCISDFRLWDIVKPPTQLESPNESRHPRHIPPQTQENLLCYFPMTEMFGRDISNHQGPRFTTENEGLGPIIPDQSPNRHDGHLSVGPDTPTWQQNITNLPIYRDKALELNGTDQRLQLPWSADLDLLNQSFTIEVWIKVDTFDKSRPILGSGYPSLHKGTEVPRPRPFIFEITEKGQIKAGIISDVITSEKSLTLNNWQHVAWRLELEDDQIKHTLFINDLEDDQIDQIKHTLFINGNAEGRPQTVGQGFNHDFPLFLGSSLEEVDIDTTTAHYFKGQIAELRIWNIARSDRQIEANHKIQLQPGIDALTGYWIFNQEPKQVILDQTQYSHRAILEIAPGPQSSDKWKDIDSPFKRQSLALDLNPDPAAPIDYIDLHCYDIQEQGTLEIWVKFTRGRHQIIFDASASEVNCPFTLAVRRHHLRFRLVDRSGQILCAQIDLRSFGAEFDHQFHHVVAIWDQTQQFIELYLDELHRDKDHHPVQAQEQCESNERITFQTPYIGLERNFNPFNFDHEVTSASPFRGKISQLRIWDHIRHLEDIQRHRYADLEGLTHQPETDAKILVEPGLVSYLPIVLEKSDELVDLATLTQVPIRRIAIPHPMPNWQVVDYYVDLDGKDDYIEIEAYQPTAQGTIELWTKFKAKRNQILLDASNDDPSGQPLLQKYFLLEVRDSVLRFKLEDGNDLDFKLDAVIGKKSFADFDDQWHHIVVTWRYSYEYNTVSIQLGLDGHFSETAEFSKDFYAFHQSIKRLFSPTLSGGGRPDFKSLFIGNLRGEYYTDPSDFPPGWFDGKIRQVRIWDDVRTEQEIREYRDIQILESTQNLLVNLLINEGHDPAEVQKGVLYNNQTNSRIPYARLLVGTVSELPDKWHPYDHAIDLDGLDSFIQLYGYRPQREGCIELWLKFSRDRDQILVDASESSCPFILEVQERCLRFQLSKDSFVDYSLSHLPYTFNEGWHHVAITWKWLPQSCQVATRLFIDGHQEHVVQRTSLKQWPEFHTPYIGRSQNSKLQNLTFQGQIRRIRVWRCTRSEKQLEDFRFVPNLGSNPHLVFDLPISKGSGNRILNRCSLREPALLKKGIAPQPEWQKNKIKLFKFQKDYAVLPHTSTLDLINSDFTIELAFCLENLGEEQVLLGVRGPRDPALTNAEFSILINQAGHLQIQYQNNKPLEASRETVEPHRWYRIICQYSREEQQLSLWVTRQPRICYEYNSDRQQLCIILAQRDSLDPYILHKVLPYQDDRRIYLGYSRSWDSSAEKWNIRHFHGYIDEVRIWRGLRSLDDIKEHLDRRLKGDETGLLAYWSLTDVQCNTFWAEGSQPPGAIVPAPSNSQEFLTDAQPKISLPRSAPRLDGFNDYLDLYQTFLKSDETRTIEFWFANSEDDWKHLAAIFSRENADPSIYLNGNLDTSKKYEQLLNAKVYDQSSSNPPDSFVKGVVSEFRLWHGSRSIQEIRENRNRSLTGREPNLWAYWPLAEGKGDDLVDLSETLIPASFEPGLENAIDKWQRMQTSPFDADAETALYFDGNDDHIVLPDTIAQAFDQPHYDRSFEIFVFKNELQPHISKWMWLMLVLYRAQITQDFTVEAWIKLDATTEKGTLPILGVSSETTNNGQRQGITFGFDSKRPYIALVREYGLRVIRLNTSNDLKHEIDKVTTKGLVIIARIGATNANPNYNYHVRIINWSGNQILNQPANRQLSEELDQATAGIDDNPTNRINLIQTIFASFGLTVEHQSLIRSDVELGEDWHHIVWQYRAFSQKFQIFIDGVPAGGQERMAPELKGNRTYLGQGLGTLGDSPSITVNYFQGWIAEVRLWKTAISEDWITRYNQRPLPGRPQILEHLLAYWIFDDRSRALIPSLWTNENNNDYNLWLKSDSTLNQPTWKNRDDYPLLLSPLPQNALKFDGQSQYLATDRFQFNYSQFKSFTIELWIKVEDNKLCPIVWWGDRDQTSFELCAENSKVAVYLENNKLLESPDSTIVSNQFTHVALILKQTRVTLILNGKNSLSETVNIQVLETGKDLQVGRGDRTGSPQYFTGLIQELRIWNSARSYDEIRDLMYHPLNQLESLPKHVVEQRLPELEHLIGYWPLTHYEVMEGDRYMPHCLIQGASVVAPPLRLAGLVSTRKPSPGEPEPTRVVDARRKVLTFPIVQKDFDISHIGSFKKTESIHRPQRTVEIWFQCEDPFPSRKQILYEEGDCDRQIAIYIKQGKLHFIGFNRPQEESGWNPETHISTHRIHPKHWHHAVLVLDGRNEVHDNVLCAILDGRVINTDTGSQLWGQPQAFCMGGLRQLTGLSNKTISTSAQDFDVQTGHWQRSKNTIYQAPKQIEQRQDSNPSTTTIPNPASIEYRFKEPAGLYQIWIKYPAHKQESQNAPSKQQAYTKEALVQIVHRGGSDRQKLNQTIGGSRWHFIGNYELEHNGSMFILSNQSQSDNGLLAINQLKFVKLDNISGRPIDTIDPIVLQAEDYSAIRGQWTNYEDTVLCTKKTDIDESGVPATLEFIYRGSTGRCQIILLYPTHPHDEKTPNYATNTLIEVDHRHGMSRVEVDQEILNPASRRLTGEQWQEIDLGWFDLASGSSKVRISNKDVDGQVILGEIQFIYVPSLDAIHQLQGQIRELRIWEGVRSLEQIQSGHLSPDGNELLFHWQTETIAAQSQVFSQLVSPMKVVSDKEASLSYPSLPLLDLGQVHQLLEEPRQTIDRLGVLWSNIKHTGVEDNKTLFDKLFNSGTRARNNRWTYGMRLRWEAAGQTSGESRKIRKRLEAALGVSSANLDVLLGVLSGKDFGTIILDGDYLSKLYRLKLLSKILDFKIPDLVRFYNRMMQEYQDNRVPLNEISNLTVQDVIQLKHRSDWLKKLNITIEEYEYLVYDIPFENLPSDNNTPLPVTNEAVVQLANNVLESIQDNLCQASQFESEIILFNAAAEVYRLLLKNQVLSGISLKAPDDGSASTEETQDRPTDLPAYSVVNPKISGAEQDSLNLPRTYLKVIGENSNWLLQSDNPHIPSEYLRRKTEKLVNLPNSRDIFIESIRFATARSQNTADISFLLPQSISNQLTQRLNERELDEISKALSAPVVVNTSTWLIRSSQLDPVYIVQRENHQYHFYRLTDNLLFTVVNQNAEIDESQSTSLSSKVLMGDVADCIEALNQAKLPLIIERELMDDESAKSIVMTQSWSIFNKEKQPLLVIKAGLEEYKVYTPADILLFTINHDFEVDLKVNRLSRKLRRKLADKIKNLPKNRKQELSLEEGLKISHKAKIIPSAWIVEIEGQDTVYSIQDFEKQLSISRQYYSSNDLETQNREKIFTYNSNLDAQLNQNQLPKTIQRLLSEKLNGIESENHSYSLLPGWVIRNDIQEQSWTILLDSEQFKVYSEYDLTRPLGLIAFDSVIRSLLNRGQIADEISNLLKETTGYTGTSVSKRLWFLTYTQRPELIYKLELLNRGFGLELYFDQILPETGDSETSFPLTMNLGMAWDLDQGYLYSEDSEFQSLPDLLVHLYEENSEYLSESYKVIPAEWLIHTRSKQFTLTVNSTDQQNDAGNAIEFYNGWLDNFGRVMIAKPATLKTSQLINAYSYCHPSTSSKTDSSPLQEVREKLTSLRKAQDEIPVTIDNLLSQKRNDVEENLYINLAAIFEVSEDLLKEIVKNDEFGSFIYGKGELKASVILEQLIKIRDLQDPNKALETSVSLTHDLKRFWKLLFIFSRFANLTELERITLLRSPNVFGLNWQNLINPSFSELTQLYIFGILKNEIEDKIEDGENSLVNILSNSDPDIPEISAITQWSILDINALTKTLDIPLKNISLLQIEDLRKLFDLVGVIGIDSKYLIDLASISSIKGKQLHHIESDFIFYERHASALANFLQSKYDTDTWKTVNKPLHDRISTLKREALIGQIMEQKATALEGRKSPDALYEYLLLDVQTGSELYTSFIVQAHAALQLYVQRCFQNLEKYILINEKQTVLKEWEWVKKYRVWEANRKVFLYPENYLEPDLRTSKSRQFEILEEELNTNEISLESAEKAVFNYISEFKELASLKIVGSSISKDISFKDDKYSRILFLVGKTTSQPSRYFHRQYFIDSKRWSSWEEIDLTINSDNVSPVYAFGRLFIFWTEFSKLKRSVNEGKSKKEIDVYLPEIKYSYLSFSQNSWIAPQTRFHITKELRQNQILQDKWKKIYVQQKSSLSPEIEDELNIAKEVPVIIVSRSLNLIREIPNFDKGKNPREKNNMEKLTWSFWIKVDNLFEVPKGDVDENNLPIRELILFRYFDEDQIRVSSTVRNSYSRIEGAPNITELKQNHRDKVDKVKEIEKNLEKLRKDLTDKVALADEIKENINDINNQISIIRITIDNARFRIANASNASERVSAENDLRDAQSDLTQKSIILRTENTKLQNEIKAARQLKKEITEKESEKSDEVTKRDTADNKLKEALDSPLWKQNALTLTFTIDGNETEEVSLLSSKWQFISFGLAYDNSASRYEVEILIHDTSSFLNKNKFNLPLSGNINLSGKLRIGLLDASNSSIEEAYQVLMSEFQIWNELRDQNTITNSRFKRVETDSSTVFSISLDGNEGITESIAKSGLSLIDVTASIIRLEEEVERLLLFYGGFKYSLRNNINDEKYLDIEISQDDEQDSTEYDLILYETKAIDKSRVVNLSVTYSKNPLGFSKHNTQQSISQDEQSLLAEKGVLEAFEDLASSESESLEKDIEQESLDVEKNIASIGELKQFWKDNTVLSNLKPLVSSLLHVSNQPGFYILCTGNEHYLVSIRSKKETELNTFVYSETYNERIKSKYTSSDNKVEEYSAQKINLTLRPLQDNDLLKVKTPSDPSSPDFQIEFERISTSAIHEYSINLFKGGLKNVFSLDLQQTKEIDFIKYYKPSARVIENGPFKNDSFVIPDLTDSINFYGAYGLYYRELHLHIPILIANKLSNNQKFHEAQKVLHCVFNPMVSFNDSSINTRDLYWGYLPFYNLTIETFYEKLSNHESLDKYRKDPLDPHAIAQLRVNSYQKMVVMKYIDNLLAWADFLFRQDNRESINEALLLYILSYNILGPRPKVKPKNENQHVGSFNDIKSMAENHNEFRARNSVLSLEAETDDSIGFNPHSSISRNFDIPENQSFQEYWKRIENRLFNIRHSLSIDGKFRTLPLFQPPIDPAVLIKAINKGKLSIGNINNISPSTSLPFYRFEFLLDKAKELLDQTILLGQNLLQSLEKKDKEELTLILHSNELSLLESILKIHKLKEEELTYTLMSLESSKQNANQRRLHYQNLIERGLNNPEKAQLALLSISTVLQATSQILKLSSAGSATVPDQAVGGAGPQGSPVALTLHGGSKISDSTDKSSDIPAILSQIANTSAHIIGLHANYERRHEDWEFQQQTSELDISIIDNQIDALQVQAKIAKREHEIHTQKINQYKEVDEFYRKKFSNKQLYSWMIYSLSNLYFQTYKIAFDISKEAELAFQFEFASNDTFVNYGHWNDLKKGLVAGEALKLDLVRLEKASIDRNSRQLEITKHVSLAQLDPFSLLKLKETGRCQFRLDELLYDRDYPGHYCRMIKTVSISIPAVVGPYQTFRATLTQTGNQLLLSPNIDGVKYLLGEEQESPPVIRADYRANQQIAVSTGVEDSGMFELNFGDSRYLPFEGTGAVSSWLLEMPKVTNPIDFNSISDIIIHLRYTAKSDGGLFKQEVMDLETFKTYKGARLLSLAHDMPSQWQVLKTSPTPIPINIPITSNLFPPNVRVEPEIDPVEIQQIYNLNSSGELTEANSFFDDISINAESDIPFFTLTPSRRFKPEQVENLLLFINFTGRLIT